MNIIHRYHSPFKISKQLLKGRTLIRSLFNEEIRNYKLYGRVLDLGSKSINSRYYKYIGIDAGCEITFTDLYENEGVVKVNVEEDFPFDDNTFDMVITFHLFEHVFDFSSSAEEIYRVLKPGGKLIISVPFMHKYHADPDDYFRFTDSAIIKTWERGGLKCESMDYIGEGIYTYFLTTMMKFERIRYLSRPMQLLVYFIGTIIDRAINIVQLRNKNRTKTTAQIFALEHIAVFVK